MLKCAFVVLLALASSARAASLLPQAFSCGTEGVAGGLGGGDDLTKYVVDTARYPNALCNDGTPAVFYYHDAVWNWWTGAQPQVVIRPFTGAVGAAPECP